MGKYLGDNMKHTKKRKFHKSYFLIVGLFLYVLSLSIGFAYFTESLKINGVASTVDYYSSNMLPTDPIIQDAVNNRYSIESASVPGIDFVDEYWIGDTCYVKYLKRPNLTSTGAKQITYTVTFSNPTAVEYTDLIANNQMIENSNGAITRKETIVDKTIVAPGEVVTVQFTVYFNFQNALKANSTKANVSYMVQGTRKYFYLVIDYAIN